MGTNDYRRRTPLSRSAGFTLIEVVLIIILLGVLATVAVTRLDDATETAKFEQTRKEMQQLAYAIAGNPRANSGDGRSDFGYVGDVGSIPGSLDNLVTNPGYGTWDGPYVSSAFDTDGFKKDAWNVDYLLVDTVIRSTGSGQAIDLVFATSQSALVSNTVNGRIVDGSHEPPRSTFKDSVQLRLTYPDGSGGLTTAVAFPSEDGSFSLSGIPIGEHTLDAVFSPTSDTVSYRVPVYPAREAYLDLVFPADLW
jgi:type II secretory pathway pseudopilin PulG